MPCFILSHLFLRSKENERENANRNALWYNARSFRSRDERITSRFCLFPPNRPARRKTYSPQSGPLVVSYGSRSRWCNVLLGSWQVLRFSSWKSGVSVNRRVCVEAGLLARTTCLLAGLTILTARGKRGSHQHARKNFPEVSDFHVFSLFPFACVNHSNMSWNGIRPRKRENFVKIS